MRLLDIVQGKLVIPQMRARTKWDAIDELVDRLVEEHEIRIFDQPDVLEAVLVRERSLSTGLQDHVALPHARMQVVDDLIGVLGIAPDGIPFESIDGKDAVLIALLIVPEYAYREHIHTLTMISALLSRPDFRSQLVAAGRTGSAQQVIEIIERTEGREFLQDIE